MKSYYRLTSRMKKEIAQNLIDIIDEDIEPSKFAKSLSLNSKLPKDFDYKKEIGTILSKKYDL